MVFKTTYRTFEEFAVAYNVGSFTKEMREHKVQLLPVYEKIAIDRNNVYFNVNIADFYNEQYASGSIPKNDGACEFRNQIETEVKKLSTELKENHNVIPCQFREKLKIENLLSEENWETYKERQIKREEIQMFTAFNYSLDAEFR